MSAGADASRATREAKVVRTGAMILAAGLGTRLRPLTELLPKPLAPIGDEAAIEHVLVALERAGFPKVVVNAHHLAARLEDMAAADRRLILSLERDLLGTAGGVHRARASGLLAGERALVVNGDLFGALPLAELGGGAEVPVARLLVAEARGEGNVGVDVGGRVVRIRRESPGGAESRRYDYLGCALLGPESLEFLPQEGCLVGDVFLPLLRRGAALDVHVHEGPWLDVGSLAAYLEANLRWLRARGVPSFVHARATIEAGASVGEGVVVGAGAIVRAGARLDHVVVWPGACVTAGAHSRVVVVPDRAPIAVA